MESAQQPGPILVVDLFPEVLEALLDLLGGLSPAEWEMPTICAPWTVKEVALHLLGADVGILSRGRDGYRLPGPELSGWADLVTFVDALNERWMAGARRMSPRLIRDFLGFTGPQVSEYFSALDPYAIGGPVSWAGAAPAPTWFDLAREYTERWHHQQHIRDAVGKPGSTEPRYFAPVLDTFVRALPHTLRDVDAPEGACVALILTGDSGGAWFVRREHATWTLYQGYPVASACMVVLSQDIAWRLFTKGIGKDDAAALATIEGDQRLGLHVLDVVSIIA